MSRIYIRKAKGIECEPWREGADMGRVSVSDADREAGSPRVGDMIARNPENADDRWLISAAFFRANYEAGDGEPDERVHHEHEDHDGQSDP